jgi:NDP-sugar pyrophosphorylase family protein
MAPVGGRPFLEYLIGQLRRHDVTDVLLSIGHLAQQISNHFGDGTDHGARISYSVESEPLGTGGAVIHARSELEGAHFLVMNGDSFLDLDLTAFITFHRATGALASMALTPVEDNSRYGSVGLGDDGQILGFTEKGELSGPGLINSGIYLLAPSIFDRFPQQQPPVSLERDLFPTLIGQGFFGHEVRGFFRDIGIPEDYQAMCDDPSPLERATER